MDERGLRGLLDQVKAGAMSRRAFVRRMAAVGLAAPFANQLLALSGVAMAQTRPIYKPTKRGGGGLLKVLWWQGPTLLNPHFFCDLQMFTTTMTQPDPEVFMLQFISGEAATKENKWQGRNITRWQNKEYDETHKAASVELDPAKRAALLIKCNEMAINNQVVIPVVTRPQSTGVSNKLVVELTGWDTNTWDLANWYREA